MSNDNSWVAGLAILAAIGAVATKPNESAFKARVDNIFSTARDQTFYSGNIPGWLGAATADNLRSGIYRDNIIYAEYIVTVGGQAAIKCTGIFGSISCEKLAKLVCLSDVGALVDIDHDARASGDKGRDEDAHAIVEHGGLIRRGGGLPLHHGVGFDNRGLDLFGERHADRAILIHFEHSGHAILQKGCGIADQVLRQVDLVVGFHIHEHQILALGIEELEILGIEAHLLHRVLAAETHIVLAPVDQVLHLDLHEGPALAGLGVLGFGNLPDTFFVFDNVAGANFDAADLHGIGLSMDKNRKWRCDCSRLRALSAGLAIWQSCCALAVLALAGPALAGAEGPLVTAKRGEYTCETPGTALTSSGLHQPEEDFAIRQGSIYTNPAGRGSYLASGDEIRMTSGPKSGQRFRRTSENFLRKLTLEGQESDIRCVRKVLNNR